MIERLRKIAIWIDDRVYISKIYKATAGHIVPRTSGSWFYVFGSGTLLCFMIQIVSGICLALVYVPSASQAYTSLEYLNYQQQLGWFLRAMHNWGSNFMVAIMLAHLIQVFLFGAFKYPREMTWISGVVCCSAHSAWRSRDRFSVSTRTRIGASGLARPWRAVCPSWDRQLFT